MRTQGRRPVRGGRRRGREATGDRRWGEPPTPPPSLGLPLRRWTPPRGSRRRAEDPILGTEPEPERERWRSRRSALSRDMDGYHSYLFLRFGPIWIRIRIRIRIMLTISDKIRLDVDIINIRFKYSDTNTVLDIEYSDSNMDRSKPLYRNSVSNTVGKYPYHFHH